MSQYIIAENIVEINWHYFLILKESGEIQLYGQKKGDPNKTPIYTVTDRELRDMSYNPNWQWFPLDNLPKNDTQK